ncbi:homeobox transcription factor [Aspergillus steynii IBT 23096]|uniref:Homeobox transcription factor n=1 Tax=Aspergillus steynii IBT 23096 TaxID=1392250 RepID=A0A2I2GPP8_9EURO|nr:homeobox transcription factor [Aspergillus steynii IBT 23096]PLB54846.1 homeobox transcription factor [Aspergillus steynii IBT 23096]
MSQPREQGEDSNKMAISYASGLPADHTQALPSFRELLPPHLHDEIESTSYFTSRQHSHERPASASHDLTSNHRLMSERPYGSPSKLPMAESPRDYSIAAHPRDPRLPQTAGSTPPYASRGPSPILPPIRDLQSLPDRGLNPTNAAFPDARGLARPDPYAAAHEMRSGPPVGSHGFATSAANYPGPMGDRRSAEAYVGANGAPVMHYPYSAMVYQSDSEQTSPQGLSHGPQSNFGILGDPADSRNKRRRGNLPKPVTDILRAWFHEHLDHPYPSEEDKQMFMTRTGLTISQISNWFINARRRQLPALRNQMRNGGSDLDPQRQSPFSDVEHTSSESMPSPHMLNQS